MSNVTKNQTHPVKGQNSIVTIKAKQLEKLRIASERRRAARAATPNRSDEARTKSSSQGSGGSSPKVKAEDRTRREVSKENDLNHAAGRSGGNSPSGLVRQMATKLVKIEPSQVLRNKIASHEYKAMDGSHPYKLEEHGQHGESIPVIVSKPENGLNSHMKTTMEAVMTPYGPGVKIRGREYMNTIATDSRTYEAGQGIVAFPLNPRLLNVPRLATLSKLYTRFIFNRFDLHYAHSAGTFNNGSLEIFGVYDPTINPLVRPGETLISYATERWCKDFNISQDTVLNMNDSNFKDLLFLEADDDLRWTMQGIAYCIAAGSIAANIECGKLILDYEITLANDDLEDEELLIQRSYRGLTMNFRNETDAVASLGRISSANAIPRGKYLVVFRTTPDRKSVV